MIIFIRYKRQWRVCRRGWSPLHLRRRHNIIYDVRYLPHYTQIHARTPACNVYVYYYTFPERARARAYDVYTTIYYMWANTCPLVDAYAPALPQTSADVYQGSQSSGRATAALRVATRVHYFYYYYYYSVRRPPLRAAISYCLFIIIIIRDTIERR